MRDHMKRIRLTLCLYIAIILLAIGSPLHAIAVPIESEQLTTTIEEDKELLEILQSSLSVVELDREIQRIQSKIKKLEANVLDMELELYERELDIQQKQKEAGAVLVAYYKGERSSIYLSLLKSKDFSELLQSLELIEYIIKNDRNIIESFIVEYKQLSSAYEKFAKEKEELLIIEDELEKQRHRVLELEGNIQSQLEGRSDAERVELLIKELTEFWEKQGIAYVETYFEKLAHAMNNLPSWLQKNKQYMSNKGFTYTITLPDEALNQYLKEYDPIFEYFEFEFSDGTIMAKGKKENIEIVVTGYYSLIEEPDNYIHFTIEALTFNGFTLPETTMMELMEQFDLNFYPGLIIKFLKAKKVEVTPGNLTIELKLTL